MTFVQADLDALNAALATGAEEVRYADGRLVKYRKLAELQAAIALVAAALSGSTRTLADDRVVSGYNSNLSQGAPCGLGYWRW